MSYKRAETILPIEIIEMIQNYVEGESIYIPRKNHARKCWGDKTGIKQELASRNTSICHDYQQGMHIAELSIKYCLSVKSIERIVYKSGR